MMHTDINQNIIDSKCVFSGDYAVGKTSIIRTYRYGEFNERSTATIGAEFSVMTINDGSDQYRLNFWDTAGQERYRAVMPLYYRNADVVVVVVDCSEPKTIQRISDWVKFIQGETYCEILVAVNKIDLVESLDKLKNDLNTICTECNVDYILVSCKRPETLRELFETKLVNIVKIIYSKENKKKLQTFYN